MIGTPQASPLLNAVCGLIPLALYILFALLVTRQQDFYAARRWKAAVLCASLILLIAPSLLGVTLLGMEAQAILRNPAILGEIHIQDVLKDLPTWLSWFLCLSGVFAPLIFLFTLLIYYRLKFVDFNSDDWLDKIWKDPDPHQRSPIQWE